MLIKLLFLFTIAIIAVQGAISSSRIDTDAAKWTELYKKYMDSLPDKTFREEFKAECSIMLECCPRERVNFFNIIQQKKFEETCIGSRSSSTFKSLPSKCKNSIQQLDNIKKSPEYSTFLKVMASMPTSDGNIRKWRTQMASVCSADELEAYYCEPEDMKKFQSCQKKVLGLVASENNGKNYGAYVQEWKDDYATTMKGISKYFTPL